MLLLKKEGLDVINQIVLFAYKNLRDNTILPQDSFCRIGITDEDVKQHSVHNLQLQANGDILDVYIPIVPLFLYIGDESPQIDVNANNVTSILPKFSGYVMKKWKASNNEIAKIVKNFFKTINIIYFFDKSQYKKKMEDESYDFNMMLCGWSINSLTNFKKLSTRLDKKLKVKSLVIEHNTLSKPINDKRHAAQLELLSLVDFDSITITFGPSNPKIVQRVIELLQNLPKNIEVVIIGHNGRTYDEYMFNSILTRYAGIDVDEMFKLAGRDKNADEFSYASQIKFNTNINSSDISSLEFIQGFAWDAKWIKVIK